MVVMGFEEEQNGAPGCVPEFGAIFMSNRATGKECFKRKLLGLPSGMANFVKQVKAGMVLFLFEYEKRELHGVFQASSDGAMNIVPHAYISSGKQFPAQVKFTPLWRCSPLCEDEFCDAIKENYFSKNKFNFGLSEDQVHKLLSLFSLRKLKVQPRQKHVTISKVPSYSTSKFRGASDDDKSIMKNQLTGQGNASCHRRSVISNEYFVDSLVSGGRTTDGGRTVTSAGELNKYKLGNQFEQVISKDYFEESLHEVGRVTNDGRFATTDCERNEHDMDFDLRAVTSTKHPDYSFDNEVRRIPNDVRFSKVNKLGLGNNGDKGYGAASSTMYPGSDQCNSYTASYTHNSDIVRADSLVHKQFNLPLPLPGSMKPQVSKFSCSIPSGDANITSTCPYDPDVPGINYWLSSSEVNHSLQPVSDSDPSHDSNAVHIFPSVGNRSLLSCVEPVGTRRSSDANSGFESSVPMPLSGKHHEFSGRTGRPFFATAFSEKVEKDFSKNEDVRGVSFLETSSTTGPFLECRNSDEINEGPSSSYRPSIVPSFVFDYRRSLTSQEKRDHEAFACNVPTLKQDHRLSQGHDFPVEFDSIDRRDNYSLNPVVYRSSRNMDSDCQKSRISVFSRLGIASDVHIEESDTAEDNYEDVMDISADEIMSMLHQSQYQWVKMRNHMQSTVDNAKNFRKKRQTTSNFELLTVQKISKGMVMDGTAETEDNDDQFAAMTPFVDFKRRSEVRKTRDDNIKISGCNENAEKDESGGLRKRRKLIRPNFNKSELPDVNSIDTSEKVGPHLLCQISHEDKYIEAERASNCGGEETVETCGATSRNADNKGKELSPKFGSRNMQLLVSPEEKSHNVNEALVVKESMLDGVVQDLKNSNQSTGLPSSLQTHENNTKRITAIEEVDGSYRDLNISKQSVGQDSSLETSAVNAIVSTSSETESCRGNVKDLNNFDKVYPLDGEMEANRANYSSNQNSKSDKAAENLIGNGSKGCDMDVKQNVANKNDVLSCIGDTTMVGCKAISSILKQGTSQSYAENAINNGG